MKSEKPEVLSNVVVRPGKFTNGQDRDGTPESNVHSGAKEERYADGAKHRASLRSDAYPGAK